MGIYETLEFTFRKAALMTDRENTLRAVRYSAAARAVS